MNSDVRELHCVVFRIARGFGVASALVRAQQLSHGAAAAAGGRQAGNRLGAVLVQGVPQTLGRHAHRLAMVTQVLRFEDAPALVHHGEIDAN